MKLERIVVGIDFSIPSLAAARWTTLHFAPQAETFLVHVIREPDAPAYSGDLLESGADVVARSRENAARRLGELTAGIAADGVETVIREGRAPEALAREAAERGSDVIVVGEHGERPGAWDFLGSTAERVLRHADRPVLLAKNPRETRPRSIVAAVDDSEFTGPVLAWTRFLRETFSAEVAVVHALTPVLHSYFRMVSSRDEARALEEKLRSEAYRWLDGRVAEAGFSRDDESPPVSLDVAAGHPAYEVLAGARRHDADLLVVGTRGRGTVERLVLGSVAASVLRGASVPVLVVPTPEEG